MVVAAKDPGAAVGNVLGGKGGDRMFEGGAGGGIDCGEGAVLEEAGFQCENSAEVCSAPRADAGVTEGGCRGDGQRGEPGPRDPASERILNRNAVEKDLGPAGAARADVAEAEALRGGMRDEAVGAPEQAEARDGSQDRIHALLGCGLDPVLIEGGAVKRSRTGPGRNVGGLDGCEWKAGGRARIRIFRRSGMAGGEQNADPSVERLGAGESGVGAHSVCPSCSRADALKARVNAVVSRGKTLPWGAEPPRTQRVRASDSGSSRKARALS